VDNKLEEGLNKLEKELNEVEARESLGEPISNVAQLELMIKHNLKIIDLIEQEKVEQAKYCEESIESFSKDARAIRDKSAIEGSLFQAQHRLIISDLEKMLKQEKRKQDAGPH
jgi:hypothetical protein